MKKCFLATVAAATVALLVTPLRAAGQFQYEPLKDEAKEQGKAQKAAEAGPIRRMPDGKPDLRGTWTKVGGGLNEANPKLAALNIDCREAFGSKAEPDGFTGGPDGRGTLGARRGQRPQYEPVPAPPRGIIDPPDRVLPWRAEAWAAQEAYAAKMCCPVTSIEYSELSTRCTPSAPWYDSRGSIQIMQRPGQVVLFNEWNHITRVFYTDGRPHLGPNMRFFGGDSVGRWEGDTLVVDTTNLNGMGAFSRTFQTYGDAMHLTERYTPVSDKLINYEIIFDDPKLFTRPIKSVGYFFPSDDGEEIVELTCHEGSYTLQNIFGF